MCHSLGRVQDQVCNFIPDRRNLWIYFYLVAGNLLLHTKEPLFKRYISMSGTALMLQPLPPPVSEFVYSNVIKSLGAEDLSSQERIKKLLDLPNDELATIVPPNLPLLPIVDGGVIAGNFGYAEISSEEGPAVSMPGRSWCEELLIGDCQFDVSSLQHIPGRGAEDKLTGINLRVHAWPSNSRYCKNVLQHRP
jgi:hypothetical protein